MYTASAPHPALRAGLLLVALLALSAVPAGATTRSWNNAAGGAWSVASNWSPSGVPGAGDVAQLGSLSGAYTVTLDVAPAADELDVDANATVDASAQTFADVLQLHNGGTLLGFHGVYDGMRVHNETGGVIQVASADSMILSGDVTNDGTIEVGPNVSSAIEVVSTTTVSGSGRIQLAGQGRISVAGERPTPWTRLVNAAGHTISGAGNIWPPVNNYGTILSDGSQGDHLWLRQVFYNYGTVRVSGGAVIQVDAPLVKQYNGRIIGDNGSFLIKMPYETGGTMDNIHGGSLVVDGGDLTVFGGAIVEASIERTSGTGAVALAEGAITNHVVVQSGAELRVDGLMDVSTDSLQLENHGIVRVRGTMHMDGPAGQAQFFYGDGAIVLDGGLLGTTVGGLMVNGAGHTIRGCGTIEGDLDNEGTVDIDCSSYFPATIQGGRVNNPKRIHVTRGILQFKGSALLINRGTLDGDGGQIKVQEGAKIDNTGGTLRAGINHVYFGDRHSVATVVGGTLTVPGGYTVDGLLKGYGKVVGDVTNAALVQPDVAASPLTVQGAFRQASTGRVAFAIGGAATGSFARLAVTGAATLDGLALVSTVNGYQPPGGATFAVLSYGSRTGQFSGVAPDPGLALSANYAPTALTLASGSTVGVGDLVPTALWFAARGDRFALALPQAARVTVVAYSAAGRTLGTLLDGELPAGTATFGWSGLRTAPASGIAFARATVRFADHTEMRTARALLLH